MTVAVKKRLFRQRPEPQVQPALLVLLRDEFLEQTRVCRQQLGHFILERRVTQREILTPPARDCGPFLEEKEGINRNHDQAEEKAGEPEKTAHAGLDQGPELGQKRR